MRKFNQTSKACLFLVVIVILFWLFGGGKFFNFSKTAQVEITANPKDAQIVLGDNFKGQEKLTIAKITPGTYSLKVVRQGFETFSESIEIKKDQKFSKNVNLKPLIFSLKFDSEPKNSDFTLFLADGSQKSGKTPFEDKISAGEIKIKLSLSGYNPLEKTLFLDDTFQEFYYLDPQGQLVHHLFNIDGVPSPKGAVFTPDGQEIWVTLLMNKKRGVSVFRASTGEKIKDINLADAGGVEVVFSQNGSKAYVSQMETAQVYEINAKTKKILRIFNTQSAWTKILELSKDGLRLFAANWSGDDVSEIDLTTGKLKQRLPTVDTPRGLYTTQDGKTLYVAGFENGEIQKINIQDKTSQIIFNSRGAMRHFVADDSKGILYASDMAKNLIWQVDLKTDQVKKFADTDTNPNTIELSPDKKILTVSCRGANASSENYYIPGPEWGSVLLFDTQTGEILDAIVGGNQPTALDISPDGKFLVFSDFLDSRLEIFEIPDWQTLKNGNGGRRDIYKQELKK